MAATESVRELILQNIATTLATIDGEDPYWTPVAHVQRVIAIPSEFNDDQKPGILVLNGGQQEEITTHHSYQVMHDMPIGIIGVMDRAEGDVGALANRFIKDVTIAMMADVTRGGYATDTRKTYQVDQSNLFGDLVIIEIEFNIRYHTDGREE